ncbi:hypothetical protein GQ53DRAFT_743109 [Thozetella sp. PMI_491]|nr:hypothetical protein GQ53DRAFT_743109 [Thozetella sp. PMI_491]
MWLLDVRKFQLRFFDNIDNAPPFAALSHCWEANEVTFADLRDPDKAARKAGHLKLRRACQTAEGLGLQWLWADTVCINRSSSAELTESVNSSFRWYRQCQVCIVHLSDYPSNEQQPADVKTTLSRCRWVRRAWTLQELIAPSKVQFYDENWVCIGSKDSLIPVLSEITRIDTAALEDPECLFDFSVGRRMSWAAKREARHVEDIAYALVGLFGVSLPVLYGEGRRAFIKLQEEIMKETEDASLFAWKSHDDQKYRGLLAHSPSEFRHFASRPSTAPLKIRGDIFISSAGFTIEDHFGSHGAAQDVILALYGDEEPDKSPIGVIFKEWNDRWVRSTPQLILNLSSLPVDSTRRIRVKRDIDERTSGMISRAVTQGGNLHQRAAGISKQAPAPKREGTGESLAQPSYVTHPQSPRTGSSSIGRLVPNHYAKSVDTETIWSGIGTAPTVSLAPRGEPCNPSYIASTSAMTSPRIRCASPENIGCHAAAPVVEEELSIYNGTASECDDSGEDDMQLFMVPPPTQLQLDPDHTFATVKDELTEHALDEFPHYLSSNSYSKRAKKETTGSASKRRKSESFDAHVEIQKPTDLEDEDMVVVGYRKLCRPALACPFYRRNPAKYRECLKTAHLPDIKALKQHLWTDHRRPYFCSVCRTIFETAAACSDHVRRRECTEREEPEIEGITEDEVQGLAHKLNPSLSLQDRWFHIWDIVFPGEEHPLQPCLSGNLETLVCLLREFWAEHGEELTSEFLDARKMLEYSVQDEERNLKALYVTVLEQLIEKAVSRLGDGEVGATNIVTTWNVMDVVQGLRSQHTISFGATM